MWRPNLGFNFIRLHYAWIVSCSLLAFPILYPYGNLEAVDAFFFGCSGSTESGLNTVNVKDLALYQQLYLYVIPVITNMMFIHTAALVVRLFWFRQHLHQVANATRQSRPDEELAAAPPAERPESCEAHRRETEGAKRTRVNNEPTHRVGGAFDARRPDPDDGLPLSLGRRPGLRRTRSLPESLLARLSQVENPETEDQESQMVPPAKVTTITFDDDINRSVLSHTRSGVTCALPFRRSQLPTKASLVVNGLARDSGDDLDRITPVQRTLSSRTRGRTFDPEGPVLQAAKSIEKVAHDVFVLGETQPLDRSRTRHRSRSGPHQPTISNLPRLSHHVTLGRNSNFNNLTESDREILGGIEYRALKMLLRFTLGYFFGLHTLGVVSLLPWIYAAPAKYTNWLAENGIGMTWWAFYSAQTMANNLGFTLTPDSMATFRDATWPMLIMTFMAFAGHTCYPVFLRLAIWTSSKLVPTASPAKESLQYLLDHPRRCFTLLFPSHPTWILLGTVVLLNFVDVLLIIVLDLNNSAVNDLPMGPRILSALFQAASSRHTGTSTLNLAEVNPAVQVSLLTMMYIAVFPIAISIRSSNTYEDRSVGIYDPVEGNLDESDGRSYIMIHVRNQLSFDLWYIFLGTFLVCALESERIMDTSEPAFSVFPVFFEVTSAYGNVGLSLGGPFGDTSMSGHFCTLSKLIVCAMMIRGRHRGLPYALDRAIILPHEDMPSTNSDDNYPLEHGDVNQGSSKPNRPTFNEAATSKYLMPLD